MLFNREPALWVGAVNAVVLLAVGFGLPVTSEQVALLGAATAAVLALVTRSQVTPVSSTGRRDAGHSVIEFAVGAVVLVILVLVLARLV